MFDINEINYVQKGNGQDILLLHGWGQNIEMMLPIANLENFRYTILDLPGFGKTPEPKLALNIYEYAEVVKQFCKQNKINKPIIIGHSFGARIAIILGAENFAKKLVLTGAAGIKEKRPLSYYYKVYTYKLLKKLNRVPFLKNQIVKKRKSAGSIDYQNATEIMKKTLIYTVNEDLTNILEKISAPTILLWGENDDATPLYLGKKMEQLIPDCALIILEEGSHYAYLEHLVKCQKIIAAFVEEK